MFSNKRVLQVCFTVFFICAALYVTYAAIACPGAVTVSAVCGPALLVLPLTVSFFGRFRRIMPYVFTLCFTADCLLLSIFTGTPLFLPLVLICGCVAVSFFVNPVVNIWFTALSNISILISFFIMRNNILSSMPAAVFFMVFALYDFAAIVMMVLVYAVRRNVGLLEAGIRRGENANRRKNSFFENTVKEMSGPINEISGLCLGLLRGGLSDSARNKTYEIQNAARNLKLCLNDACDYTRLESGTLKIEEQPYVFGSLINDIVNFCSSRLGDSSVRFTVDCEPDIPAGLVGDRVRIGQVVLALFANSLKTTKKGSITLKASSRLSGGGINLRFSVSDTGTGMPPKTLEKVFSAGSGSRSCEADPGLENARETVALMGGFMFAESVEGVGSEFTVTIPQQVTNASPFAQVENKEELFALLYLPEEAAAKPVLEKQLTQLGVHGDFCTSHKEFMLKKESPDITHIFTDSASYVFGKPIFDMLSQRARVVVVGKPDELPPDMPPAIKRIFPPLYSAAFASVFSGSASFADENSLTIAFTAPKANVLVVDDSPVNLKVVSAFLQPYEMTVFTAENGEEAINTVKNHHIDLIFMDHIMPPPDGIETTKRIRALDDPYFRSIPIIAFTANTQSDMKQVFLDSGMDDYLSKPVELSALNAAVKKWLPPELIIQSRKPLEIPVSDLPERVYDGLNPRQGILNIGGNKEAYNEILETFMNDYRQVRDITDDAVYTRNLQRYAIQVHAVKGAAANIGAADLSEFARQLESAARSGETALVTERTPVLFELYEKVNRSIKQYFRDNGVAVRKKADLSAQLPLIKRAVAECNSAEAAKLLEELLECIMPDSRRQALQLILGAVNNFDFEDAGKQLSRLEGASQ